jgi:xylulokinase
LGLGPQEGFVLSGTSESIGAVHQGPFAARDEVLDAPVWDTGYHIIYGPVSSGVSTIQWAQTVFPDFADLVLDPGGCDGERPVFLPYILGQRSPVWADRVRGAWLNIGMNTTRAALATAVLEGLAYAERDVMTFVEEVLGAGIHNIVLAGGGAHIDALNRWRQAVWRRPMEVMEAEPVLGAALLAQWADPQAHLAFPQMGNARVKRVPLDESAEKIPFVPYEKAKEAALWFSRHQERMEENG